MPRPQSPEERQWRLFHLSQEWGITLPPTPPAIEPPGPPPVFRTPNDDAYAEELLKLRQASMLSEGGNQKVARNKKGWDPSFVFAVLSDHVTDCGSPAVADSLIQILLASGGDLNIAHPAKTGLKHRMRHSDTGPERGRLLEIAVENGQDDLVCLLAPHLDAMASDLALPIAVRNANHDMVRELLRYGASIAQSEDARTAFKELCTSDEHSDIVGLILNSRGKPSPEVASQALVGAVRAHCLENAIHLTRTIASGNYNNCEALKIAISQCQRELALAVIMGASPPQAPGINEAFDVLRRTPMSQPQVLELAEILLLAGAGGTCTGAALTKYAKMGFLDMVRLLIKHGADVQYKGGRVLEKAMKTMNMDVLQILFGPESTITPVYASGCVDLLPKDVPFELRHRVLRLLLRKGAAGPSLDDALIDAAEAGDGASVELLLTPVFPEINAAHPLHVGPRYSTMNQSTARHEVASVDHKDGLALQGAVSRGDAEMVRKLLLGAPAPETLAAAFPATSELPAAERLQMVEAFLEAGLAGPPVDAALHFAIAEEPPERDDELIHLLLAHGADVNYNGGEGIPAVVALGDIELLAELLTGARQETAANAIEAALDIEDGGLRFDVVRLLLDHCAGIALEQVSNALMELLQEEPVDMPLLELMVTEGEADVNAYDGDLLATALHAPEPEVLALFIQHGRPAPDYVTKLLMDVASLPFDENKTVKLDMLIKSYQPEGVLSQALDLEIQYALELQLPQNDPNVLAVTKMLLDNGACVDSDAAAALCRAVAAAHGPIVDLLLAEGPTPQSLATALPHALAVEDPMDRLTFVKRMVDTGAIPSIVNDVLMSWIDQNPEDVPVLDVLAAACKDRDGKSLLVAVEHHNPDIVDLLLRRTKPTAGALDAAFLRALREPDPEVRLRIAGLLISAGASLTALSKALYTASAEGDVDLAQLLLESGAQSEVGGGKSIIEACRNGEVDMLNMLLEGRDYVDPAILGEAFAVATEIQESEVKAELFHPLLRHGAEGQVVDAQLAYAAREGEQATDLVKVLLEGGADPNYNNGEAVWEAAANGHEQLLDMLLGLVELGPRQKVLEQPTFLHALDAAWDLEPEARFTVVERLFDAGMEVSEELHGSLNMAIHEEQPDEHLIELLLQHGASPLAEQCKTLIEAIQRYDPMLVGLLLDREITPDELAWAFSQGFPRDDVASWFHEDGLHTAQVLLERGTQGPVLSDALVAIAEVATEEHFNLADEFVAALIEHGADVAHEDGEAIVEAASKAITPWVKDFVDRNPPSEAASRAFAHIFDEAFPDGADAAELIHPFVDWVHRGGHIDFDIVHEERLSYEDNPAGAEDDEDDDEEHGQPQSMLIRGLQLYPASTAVFRMLLDMGCDPEETASCRIYDKIQEEEEVSLLVWVLAQPELPVQSEIVYSLIQMGANVNFETPLSRLTPLMLAVQCGRPDIVHLLLQHGADLDVSDVMGNTPLALATHLEGENAAAIIRELLTAGADTDDGSLHDAARELNFATVQALVRHGHNPDFPSPLHGGRSALGELCLHATNLGPMTALQEKSMERVIRFLLESGSDPAIKCDGKTALFLALEAPDPVGTTRVLLKSGLWKQINNDKHLYTDGNYTYSPTMYLYRLVPDSPTTQQLLSLLRANRAHDVFHANSGEQPPDAVGLPKHLEVAELERSRRMTRLQAEEEDHQRSIRRSRELAKARRDLWKEQTDMEDYHWRLQNQDQLDAIRERAMIEQGCQQSRFNSELAHQEALTNSTAARVKLLGDAEHNNDVRRKVIDLEHERRVGALRMANALPPGSQGQIEMPMRHALPAPDGMGPEYETDPEEEEDDEDDMGMEPPPPMGPGGGQLVPMGQQRMMGMPRGPGGMMARGRGGMMARGGMTRGRGMMRGGVGAGMRGRGMYMGRGRGQMMPQGRILGEVDQDSM